jgi:hypothetical protein
VARKKKWPHGADWARQDAIAILDEIKEAILRGDWKEALSHVKAAKAILVAAGEISADASPMDSPGFREYVEGVVEEYLQKRKENRNAED